MPERVKRSQFAEFLNTTPSAQSESWARIGKGVTNGSIAYNPTVTDEHYIHEDSGTKEVDSYAPVLSHEQIAYKGDSVFDYVDGLRQARAVGADAETELLMVYVYDFTTSGTGNDTVKTYKAEKQSVSISINEFGGDAGNANQITYDINFKGEPTLGTVTITSGTPTFTANS